MNSSPAGWNSDPYGRHEQRYFDGTRWTEHVSDSGAQSVDDPETVTASVSGPTLPPTSSVIRPSGLPDERPAAGTPGNAARYSTGTRVAVFGGAAALVLGAFLPWVEASVGVFSFHKNGIDGDGAFTLVLGGAAALLFWLMKSSAGRVLALLAGLGATAVALYDVIDVQSKADQLSSSAGTFSIQASVGIGLWLSALGAIAVVIGAGLAFRESAA